MAIAMFGVAAAGAGVWSALSDLRWVMKEDVRELLFTAQSSLRKQVTILLSLVAFSVAGVMAALRAGNIGVPDSVDFALMAGLVLLVGGVALDQYERKRYIRTYKRNH